MSRVLPALLVALVSATALAGCFGQDDAGAQAPVAAKPETDSSTSDSSTASGPASPPPPSMPADVTVNDAGNIEGPFEKSWNIEIPEAGYREVLVRFDLMPAQDGAPVTARVFASFNAPDGASLKSVTLGLGGSNALEYSFGPGELAPGTYTLTATAQPQPGGLPSSPSFGLAKYSLAATTDY